MQLLITSQARGKHQNNRSLVRPPFTLGLEFAGTVISAPSNSTFAPGENVFGGGLGSYAEQIAINESSLHRMPKDWSFADAASLSATAPVSYGALIMRCKIKKGETVLIHAAAGGLGLMAVQIAKAVGARVIATAGSNQKLDVAKRFGADECVNYTTNQHVRMIPPFCSPPKRPALTSPALYISYKISARSPLKKISIKNNF